jgi:hypothetical protein
MNYRVISNENSKYIEIFAFETSVKGGSYGMDLISQFGIFDSEEYAEGWLTKK